VQRLIFDIGFNVGQDTAFYLSQGHRVVAVEADPTLVEAGQQRFKREIEAGRLEIVNAGIAATEGHAEFWICEGNSEFNSFYREIAARQGHRHHPIRVPTTRFSRLLERYGTPHFLKIDIEGSDQHCLADLDASNLPSYVSIECECPKNDQRQDVEDALATLRQLHRLSYRRFKLINQFKFNSVSLPPEPNQVLQSIAEKCLLVPSLRDVPGVYRLSQLLMAKPRLERKFKREFPVGCSGAWGEDTAGRWLTVEDAERVYRHYRDVHFRDAELPNYSFWYDWHAAI
jgi:FkbM family methyltransferase